MRPGQKNRMRGGRGNNSGRRGPNPLTRSFESNGPDVKVRGTPQHIAEKYVQLARDAHSAGDTVMAEAYLQHAEHYYRIISAAQALQQAAYNQANGIPNPEQDQEEEDEFEVSGSDRFVFRTPQSFQQQGLGGPNFNEGSEQPMSGEGQPMADSPAHRKVMASRVASRIAIFRTGVAKIVAVMTATEMIAVDRTGATGTSRIAALVALVGIATSRRVHLLAKLSRISTRRSQSLKMS
jgi:Domain of unknown function (DUF4167)